MPSEDFPSENFPSGNFPSENFPSGGICQMGLRILPCAQAKCKNRPWRFLQDARSVDGEFHRLTGLRAVIDDE